MDYKQNIEVKYFEHESEESTMMNKKTKPLHCNLDEQIRSAESGDA